MPSPEATRRIINEEFADVIRVPGNRYYVDAANGSDSRSGKGWPGFATIQKAVDEAAAGDVIYVAPGEYDEAVTIGPTKTNLSIIGVGGRGSAFIAPSATNATALTNEAEDLTLENIGCEGDGTGGGLKNEGRRLRAYRCKFEGGAIAAWQKDGDDDGDSDAADCLYEDCEFAWSDVGLRLESGFNGGITQLAVRRCKFHNLADAAINSDAGADHLGIEISDCVFDDLEDGTAPTAFILLNGASANAGIVTRCSFPTALAGGLNLVDTTVHWVSNYHTGGVSTGQPS